MWASGLAISRRKKLASSVVTEKQKHDEDGAYVRDATIAISKSWLRSGCWLLRNNDVLNGEHMQIRKKKNCEHFDYRSRNGSNETSTCGENMGLRFINLIKCCGNRILHVLSVGGHQKQSGGFMSIMIIERDGCGDYYAGGVIVALLGFMMIRRTFVEQQNIVKANLMVVI